MTTLRAPTGIRLSQEEHRELSALATRNERSLAAEIRLAIRNYLAWTFSADALPISEEHRVSSRPADGQGNAAEDPAGLYTGDE